LRCNSKHGTSKLHILSLLCAIYVAQSAAVCSIRYKVVHDDGDEEDLEGHEAKQARLDFLREIESIKETIIPAVVEAAEDGTQTEGRTAHRRKRTKPEHFVAGPASGKRSMTRSDLVDDDGQGTDGMSAPTTDEQDSPRELIQLQAKVIAVRSA
jgi:hypothetical protein